MIPKTFPSSDLTYGFQNCSSNIPSWLALGILHSVSRIQLIVNTHATHLILLYILSWSTQLPKSEPGALWPSSLSHSYSHFNPILFYCQGQTYTVFTLRASTWRHFPHIHPVLPLVALHLTTLTHLLETRDHFPKYLPLLTVCILELQYFFSP